MEKNKKLMIVIIALMVVLMAIVVGVSVMAFNMINNNKADTAGVVIEENDVDFLQSQLIPLSTAMTINLLDDTDGTAHAVNLSISIAVDTSDKKNADLIAKIAGSEAIIRDGVIFVLSNKTIDQVKGNAAQDLLKEEILVRLQDEFRTTIIHKVYFGDIYFM